MFSQIELQVAGQVSEESGHQKEECFAEICLSSGSSKLKVDRKGMMYRKPKMVLED